MKYFRKEVQAVDPAAGWAKKHTVSTLYGHELISFTVEYRPDIYRSTACLKNLLKDIRTVFKNILKSIFFLFISSRIFFFLIFIIMFYSFILPQHLCFCNILLLLQFSDCLEAECLCHILSEHPLSCLVTMEICSSRCRWLLWCCFLTWFICALPYVCYFYVYFLLCVGVEAG